MTFFDLTDLSLVGVGSFSEVYSAIHRRTQARVALKLFPDSPEYAPYIDSEIAIYEEIRHPCIVQYFGRFRCGPVRGLVLELAGGGSLLQHVLKRGTLSEPEAREVFGQIVTAVRYLHTVKGIVHRDLKLENIMLTKDGLVKITDFGFAFRKNCPPTDECASWEYAAPEICMGLQCDERADCWSLGVVLYAIVHGRFPFAGENREAISEAVLRSEPDLSDFLSDGLQDLIRKLLRKDRRTRIDIEEVAEHSWLMAGDRVIGARLEQVTSKAFRNRRVSC
jgi:5'-AMP-activated protein kinase catalytic alpha subunit